MNDMPRTSVLVLLGMMALAGGFAAVPTATAGCNPHCDGDDPTQVWKCVELTQSAPIGPDPDDSAA